MGAKELLEVILLSVLILAASIVIFCGIGYFAYKKVKVVLYLVRKVRSRRAAPRKENVTISNLIATYIKGIPPSHNFRKTIFVSIKITKCLSLMVLRIAYGSIQIWLKNRTLKSTIFFVLTTAAVGVFTAAKFGVKFTNHLEVVLFIIGTIGLLQLLWVITLTLSNSLFKDGLVSSLLNLIQIGILLIITVVAALEPYKKLLENQQIYNNTYMYMMAAFSLYVVVLLLAVLKDVLSKGTLWLSGIGGISIYILLLFFVSVAAGFYFTAIEPDIVQKDGIIVLEQEANDYVSSTFSYSYIGAKYLLQFPNQEDFKSNQLNAISYRRYLLFFIGLFVNTAIIAFYVSYAVSMYVLRQSKSRDYLKIINARSYAHDYRSFIKRKLKSIYILTLRELLKEKELQVYAVTIDRHGNKSTTR